MKKLKYLALIGVIGIGLAIFPESLLAATPTLNLTGFSNNSVQIVVNGDSNAGILLFYYPPNSSSLVSVGNIGTTNSSGYFSTIVNNSTYNIPSGSNTYVTVNGQRSSTILWPYNNGGGNGGSITFSQNNVILNYGQSTSVTMSGGSGSYYISSNSNSNFVNASISGNILYLSQPLNQNVGGSATIVVCSSNGNTSCGSLYLSQGQGGGNNQSISFSQNNLSLNIGQNQQVNIYSSGNTYGNYSISFNSNPNAVSATINGNYVNVYGNSQGSANITVCSSYNSSNGCATLYVNVNSSYYNQGYYNNNQYYNPPVVYTQNQYPLGYQGTYGTPSAGVFLNQVPSTGIDLNLKVFLFFVGLFAWSAFMAHIILTQKRYKEYYAQEENVS